MIVLRFFFSLKTTRIFGPFIKLIYLSLSNIVIWSLFTAALIFVMANFLIILLQENQGCATLRSCGYVLFESMVGRVTFTKMGSNWSANFALGAFSVILAAVLVNMVIAKINNIYTEVVRKGTLYYYKELLDLRFVYKLDPRYGYLSSL